MKKRESIGRIKKKTISQRSKKGGTKRAIEIFGKTEKGRKETKDSQNKW